MLWAVSRNLQVRGPKEGYSFQSYSNFLWKTSKLRKLAIWGVLGPKVSKTKCSLLIHSPGPLQSRAGVYPLRVRKVQYLGRNSSRTSGLGPGEVPGKKVATIPHILRSLKRSTAHLPRLALLFPGQQSLETLAQECSGCFLAFINVINHLLSEYIAGQSGAPVLEGHSTNNDIYRRLKIKSQVKTIKLLSQCQDIYIALYLLRGRLYFASDQVQFHKQFKDEKWSLVTKLSASASTSPGSVNKKGQS